MTTTKMIAGILGAAAAGVVMGLLMAPEKGSELRRDIKKTTDDWMNEFSHLIGQGREFVDKMKHQAAGVKHQVDKKSAKMNAE